MKRISLLLKLSLVFFLLGLFANSQAQFRKYSNEFLNIGAGARGLAMGNTQVASVKDAFAGYWNPAGLAEVWNAPDITLMHAEYFSGIGKYDFGAIAIPTKDNKRTLALSALRFGVDDIPNTLYLVEPDGSINYNNIKTFSSADYALLLSYSQYIVDQEDKTLSIGASAKVIYRNVGKFASAWGFGLDAGIQYRKDRLLLGLMAKDISTTYNAWSFKFSDADKERLYLTKNDIPVKSYEITLPRLVLGAGYNFPVSENVDLLAEVNADFTFDGKRNTVISTKPVSVDPHLGFEASINETFFIRAGITNFQRALKDGDTTNQIKTWIFQPSAGAGVKIKNIYLDYAFSNLANQSNPLFSHIISLRINLNKEEE